MNRLTRVSAGLCLVPALLYANPSAAAGWDTPIVHTARHQAMGGTAIGYVDDPSASFHNPAGYSGVTGLELLGSFSLLLGNLTASPGDYPEATNVKSNLVVAPFPLASAAYRVHEWITLGVGAYPVASGAADYRYPTSTTGEFDDSLRALFIEVSPGISLNIPESVVPGKLAFGFGYRATSVTFDRSKTTSTGTTQFDLGLSGWDFAGFRVGVQYSPLPGLRFGAVLRNKIEVTAKADEGTGFVPLTDVELDFVLPFKFGVGARYDFKRFGIAVDYEYAMQSQNDIVELSGKVAGSDVVTSLPNHFMWQDGHTVRLGFEYRAPLGTFEIPLRAGYVFDGQVGNKNYPTAFGTPPAPTNSFSVGSGVKSETWELNLACAYRLGGTTVESVAEECLFCGGPGDYSIALLGIYLDASVEFDL